MSQFAPQSRTPMSAGHESKRDGHDRTAGATRAEREEIAARVASFKATQEKFEREREEYFVTTLENARHGKCPQRTWAPAVLVLAPPLMRSGNEKARSDAPGSSILSITMMAPVAVPIVRPAVIGVRSGSVIGRPVVARTVIAIARPIIVRRRQRSARGEGAGGETERQARTKAPRLCRRGHRGGRRRRRPSPELPMFFSCASPPLLSRNNADRFRWLRGTRFLKSQNRISNGTKPLARDRSLNNVKKTTRLGSLFLKTGVLWCVRLLFPRGRTVSVEKFLKQRAVNVAVREATRFPIGMTRRANRAPSPAAPAAFRRSG